MRPSRAAIITGVSSQGIGEHTKPEIEEVTPGAERRCISFDRRDTGNGTEAEASQSFPFSTSVPKLTSAFQSCPADCKDCAVKATSDSFVENENSLNDAVKNLNYYLVLSNKKYSYISNQIVLDNLPINIFKLIEKINIEFLKQQFNSQSELKINQYTIDLNSRELLLKHSKLKLTEKEINTIIYILKSNKPVSINELQEKAWSYQSDIETHTVETHIYRLRKKIVNKFDDNEFIISKKNGYQIK